MFCFTGCGNRHWCIHNGQSWKKASDFGKLMHKNFGSENLLRFLFPLRKFFNLFQFILDFCIRVGTWLCADSRCILSHGNHQTFTLISIFLGLSNSNMTIKLFPNQAQELALSVAPILAVTGILVNHQPSLSIGFICFVYFYAWLTIWFLDSDLHRILFNWNGSSTLDYYVWGTKNSQDLLIYLSMVWSCDRSKVTSYAADIPYKY